MADVKKFLDSEGLKTVLKALIDGKVAGKGLSTNDFTDELLAKLNSTATTEGMTQLQTRLADLEKLIEADSDGAINKFNEIVDFLAEVADENTLKGLLAAKANAESVYTKTEADGRFAGKATTLSGYGITDAKIVGGVITLGGNTITPVTDVSGKVDKVAGKGLSTNDYTTAEKNLVATISDKLNASDVDSLTTDEIENLIRIVNM